MRSVESTYLHRGWYGEVVTANLKSIERHTAIQATCVTGVLMIEKIGNIKEVNT